MVVALGVIAGIGIGVIGTFAVLIWQGRVAERKFGDYALDKGGPKGQEPEQP